MNNKKIEEMERIIGEQLGQASVLFMSQECKGTEIVMPTEGLAVDKDNILEEFKKTLTQVHNSAIEGCVELVKMNSKGSFTDDAGNDCWYIDELIETLSKQKLKLKL